ncbi:MAG TPA: AAA family ATPase [Pseudomonadota bacterium]|nr:AAA family ATPase [Pseudomonadota bacterium]
MLFEESTQQVSLIDFGISARLSQETVQAANPEMLEGTLAYLSPEQTGRMNRAIDARTDLYSLGVTLYELLGGALPFSGATAMELVHSHIARRPQPLFEVKETVPLLLSDIVMKLLAKLAEDRYQSARGLKADLDTCSEQLGKKGQLSPFPLGTQDRHGTLRIPQRLYGRAAELRVLYDCFGRAENGGVELLLLGGYAGVGKSALINDIHKPIARRGGIFISGKFDQLTRSLPYAAFAQAGRALIRQLLSEPAEELAKWRELLLGRLGQTGRLLTELIPELELVIGAQPEVPELGPTESQNRFALAAQNFLRAFATADHPLVLFLDDLQWADQASLQLLKSLLTDPDMGYLLAIGAYRNNEVDRSHPLTLTVSSLRESGVAVRELTLNPLSVGGVTALVADALQSEREEVAPLAALVAQKTQGNPFFINQFLGSLHQEKLLSFDADGCRWQWDVERCRTAMVTDNVLTLMVGKLQRLPPATQEVLKLGACIGFEFELQTLTVIAQRSPTEVAADLWAALSAGLLIPQSEEYRFLYGGVAGEAELARLGPDGGLQVAFRFLHDRVQQAAYRLIKEEDRQALHARIGRLMLAQPERTDKWLFESLDHLSLAADLLQEPAECLAVAQLCHTASRRAKSAAAHPAGAKYAELGLKLLAAAGANGAPGDKGARALDFDLQLLLAESAHASGHYEQAEVRFSALLQQASSNVEHGRAALACMAMYNTLGRKHDSLRIGKLCLSRFGITLAETPEAARAIARTGFAEIERNLAGREPEELLAAPELQDPEQRMILMLLFQAATAGYFIHPALMVAPMTQHINLVMKAGSCDLSAVGYAVIGSCTAGLHKRYQEAGRFARLSLAMTEKYPVCESMAQVYFIAGAHTLPYVAHLREMPPLLARAVEVGLQVGDFVYASWSSYAAVLARFYAGDELRAVQKELDAAHHFGLRTREPVASAFLKLTGQAIANLEGRTRGRASLSDESFDEPAFVTELTKLGMFTQLCFYHVLKLQLAFLYGDPAAALTHAEVARALGASAFVFYFLNELSYYHCLALCALYPQATAEQKQQYKQTLGRESEFLATLAKSCADNFAHKHLLVLAESARIEGNALQAMELYDRAIAAAEQSGFIHQAGLANELAARFYLGLGRSRTARHYLRDAYAAYRRWGSTGKLAELTSRYPQLLLGEGVKTRAASDGKLVVTATSLLSSGLLDTDLVLRFAQAIAGEIVLTRVIEQFLRIVVLNTAAQRGVLVLSRNEQLMIEAVHSIEPDSVELDKNLPLAACSELPVAVVQRVARTREPMILNAVELEQQFATEPYIAQRRPKSLLCLPMVHRSRLAGVLYLENSSVSDVFTADRIELLHLLCAQGTIAIENALLYAHVQLVSTQLTRANDELSGANSRLHAVTAQVSRSNEELQATNARLQSVTAELAESNRELWAANERLQQEFRERAQAEQARLALQEEVIRAQRERLAELSTPIIPISAEIVVMPLIGTMDTQRAALVLDTALAGAQAARARVVILDITGMRHVDTSVAGTLINTGKALRLLGTHAILTGIRAEVAQTLVQLGVSLGGMITRSTLQSGIAYAQKLVGEAQL